MVDGDHGATGRPAVPPVEEGRWYGYVTATTQTHVTVAPLALALAQRWKPVERLPALVSYTYLLHTLCLVNLEGHTRQGCRSIGRASDWHTTDVGSTPWCGKGLFSQSQLSVQAVSAVSIQPVCAITCINICVQSEDPKHWQLYHCLDTQKYCTHW